MGEKKPAEMSDEELQRYEQTIADRLWNAPRWSDKHHALLLEFREVITVMGARGVESLPDTYKQASG